MDLAAKLGAPWAPFPNLNRVPAPTSPCNLTLEVFYGVFSSPGYLHLASVPHPQSCLWLLDPHEGRRMAVCFTALNFGYGDPVHVYDGLWAIENLCERCYSEDQCRDGSWKCAEGTDEDGCLGCLPGTFHVELLEPLVPQRATCLPTAATTRHSTLMEQMNGDTSIARWATSDAGMRSLCMRYGCVMDTQTVLTIVVIGAALMPCSESSSQRQSLALACCWSSLWAVPANSMLFALNTASWAPETRSLVTTSAAPSEALDDRSNL
ncbi:Low-density lipoprotein receptor-related protein 10 [Cricetulus griseus]|uniref:Low-density lipoprotein receptor-related protein 10 n=1 Tax=Cricetulus griseus TaxID=10029 RepID=G3IDE0_CRIGR|nr:Low-density lipoprotein receptor-related protein 10 [Cricetulus griseus]ERE87041.1 low-density lipoprotein receptor-related protein 10 [Cricetulus griseus]